MACGFMALMAHRRCLAIDHTPIGLSRSATSQGTVQPRRRAGSLGARPRCFIDLGQCSSPDVGRQSTARRFPTAEALGYPGAVHGRQL